MKYYKASTSRQSIIDHIRRCVEIVSETKRGNVTDIVFRADEPLTIGIVGQGERFEINVGEEM